MRVRSYFSGLVVLLLAFGVCRLSVCPPRGDGALSPGRPSAASTSQILSDLDGDALVDPVLFAPGNLHHHIELHLSRTDQPMILPFSATVGGHGSLAAQDLDGDGDTDLLWQRSLPVYAVRVWLNNGAGRFECVCPLDSHARGFTLRGPGVHAAQARHLDTALRSERTPVPGEVLTASGAFHGAETRRSHRPEHVGIVSCLKRLLSTRSPPLPLC